MAAERAQALGPLRFAIDADFADETVYTYESPDGRSSLCLQLEPIHEPAADRIERAAQELTRVYDDAQIGPRAPLATGAGVALTMRARVLGDTEVALAALDLGTVRAYLTATAEGGSASAFAAAVESIHRLGDPEPAAPPEHRRTGAGIVSLAVPSTWSTPVIARCRSGSAIVEIGLEARPMDLPPAELLPLAREEKVALDSREQDATASPAGFDFETAVSTYTVRDEAGAPTDAIMIRATGVRFRVDGRPAGALLGAARSADWPRLIQAWAPLLASIRVAP
jgi:hypothetical protein